MNNCLTRYIWTFRQIWHDHLMNKTKRSTISSEELIALMEAMHSVALCEKVKRQGEIMLPLCDIHEADDLLSGHFDPNDDE